MDFYFSSDEKAIEEAVKDFSERYAVPRIERLREIGDIVRGKEIILDLLKKMSELGFLCPLLPEEVGGPGLSFLESGIIYENLPIEIAGINFITSGTTRAIYEWGNEYHYEKYLSELIKGEKIGCIAITEPEAGSDLREIKTKAELIENHWVVTGTKTWITNGPIADLGVVVLKIKDKFSALVAEKPQFQVSPIKIIDDFGNIAEIVFRESKIPKENLLSENIFKEVIRGFEYARCILALIAVNISKRAIEKAIRYAQQRRQFGRSIAHFQLIQEKIARMATELECARLLAYRALNKLEREGTALKEASMAKYYATEKAIEITSEAIQVCGAVGLAKEVGLEYLFRCARILTIPDGTNEIQKLIIGRSLLGVSAFA